MFYHCLVTASSALDSCISTNNFPHVLYRFDTELTKAHDEAKLERAMKEKLQRERDTLASSQFSLEKEVQVTSTVVTIYDNK